MSLRKKPARPDCRKTQPPLQKKLTQPVAVDASDPSLPPHVPCQIERRLKQLTEDCLTTETPLTTESSPTSRPTP